MKTNLLPARPRSYLPHAPVSIRTAVWSVLTGAALVLPVTAVLSLLPIPGPDADMVRINATRMAPLYTQPWIIAVYALVVAPLWEEGVYRGLMLQMLRRYVPMWLAVAIPTVIFAGTHFMFGYHNACLAAIVGLWFTRLAVRSRSLYPAMLCHAGVNLSALFVMHPIFDAAGLDAIGRRAWGEPLLVLMLASSVALFIAGTRALAEESRRGAEPTNDAAAVALPST